MLDWTEKDVWEFLNEVVKVPHCKLYDEGWRRIGCLFSPMATRRELQKMSLRYPKYKAAIVRTIHKLRLGGYVKGHDELTDEEVFEWWTKRQDIATFYADKKLQYKLDL